MSYQNTFLTLALQQQALRFGEFTLKSGRISPYFFNAGQLYTGDALKIMGECYAKAIQTAHFTFDVLFGPAYKGIPLACATAMALGVPYAFNRKETKDHGEGGTLIGAPLANQRVLIIDDVITAGTAIRESLQFIQAHQGKVIGIVVALDRQEKGQGQYSAIQDIQQHYDLPVKAISTLTDILTFVETKPDFSVYREALRNYRHQYGTCN